MEWERSKLIMILAFLVINAIFAFQLWIYPAYFDTSAYIGQDQVDARIIALEQKNISVTAAIPRQIKRMRILAVQKSQVDHFEIAEQLLGFYNQSLTEPNPPPGYKQFTGPTGIARIYNDGRILYWAAKQDGDGSTDGGPGAEEAARRFLVRTVGLPRNAYVHKVTESEPGLWLVEYQQRWQRQQVAMSYIRVIVRGQDVVGMQYYWAEPMGYVSRGITTIPATGALLAAHEYLLPSTTITDLYLSWYSPPLTAEKWQIAPVWVIELGTGAKLYINAYTGELEGALPCPEGFMQSVSN